MYAISSTATFADHVLIERLEKKLIPPDSVASARLTWAWAQANPESLFILRDTANPNAIAGHLSAFPIRKEAAHLLLTGQMRDMDLPAADVLPYGADVQADLYFAILCVDPAHRPQGAFRLLSFFASFMLHKMRQHGRLDTFIAEAGTRNGQRLLERRGLHKCAPDADIPCFYSAPMTEMERIFTQIQRKTMADAARPVSASPCKHA